MSLDPQRPHPVGCPLKVEGYPCADDPDHLGPCTPLRLPDDWRPAIHAEPAEPADEVVPGAEADDEALAEALREAFARDSYDLVFDGDAPA